MNGSYNLILKSKYSNSNEAKISQERKKVPNTQKKFVLHK